MITLSSTQARWFRLVAQGLLPGDAPGSGRTSQIISRLVAVQAQEYESARLALWARHEGLTAAQIDAGRLERKSFIRTWAFRGTLHLLAREDAGWMLPLLGPIFIQKSRRRYTELGLTDDLRSRSLSLLDDVLSGQAALTRAELARHLDEGGIPTEGQAVYHLLRHAGLHGVLCYGPDRKGEPTYVRLDDWIPVGEPLPELAAVSALARRYFQTYGPAGILDLSAWSGLPVGLLRKGMAEVQSELVEVEAGGSQSWMHASLATLAKEKSSWGGVCRLLPAYDPYLLGYQKRDFMVAGQYARRIHPGGGLLRPTLIVDGLARGTWRVEARKGRINVYVDPFEPLSREETETVAAQAEALGDFFGRPAEILRGENL